MTAWTSGPACWWCAQDSGPVLWVGDARASAGAYAAPLYACPRCLEDLEGRIRRSDAACWWCGREGGARWSGNARIASARSCAPVCICPCCLDDLEERIHQHVGMRDRVAR
ncbi:hypothetical protein [Streptomyces sp. URMC 125]|uniref:hypothetical protein n=1 Tax=Streptomyces sp. URMC 125 TaxID=3423419 RepID=UPI003F1AC886